VEVLVQRAAPQARAPAGYVRLAPGQSLLLDEAPGALRLWVPVPDHAPTHQGEALPA
jgi:hypothetical protein